MTTSPQKHRVALAVGLYDTLVGLWPIISIKTFSDVTGLYGHDGIVKTLGASWMLLGLALLASSRSNKLIPPLGVASTLAGSTLALTQVLLVATKVIQPIFLIQSLAETTIGLTWLFTLTSDRSCTESSTSSKKELPLH
jgi:hypothetical protein